MALISVENASPGDLLLHELPSDMQTSYGIAIQYPLLLVLEPGVFRRYSLHGQRLGGQHIKFKNQSGNKRAQDSLRACVLLATNVSEKDIPEVVLSHLRKGINNA